MAMRADTSMTIRMNRDVKQEAQQIFSNLGVDMTTAINIFLRQVIYYNGFPFDVRLEVPNPETRKAIENAEKGIGMSRAFSSVSELMEDLNADD